MATRKPKAAAPTKAKTFKVSRFDPREEAIIGKAIRRNGSIPTSGFADAAAEICADWYPVYQQQENFIVCLLVATGKADPPIAVGVAKRSPEDEFHEARGRDIALYRAVQSLLTIYP